MDDSMVPTPEDLANLWPDVRHRHRPSRALRRPGMSTEHFAKEFRAPPSSTLEHDSCIVKQIGQRHHFNKIANAHDSRNEIETPQIANLSHGSHDYTIKVAC